MDNAYSWPVLATPPQRTTEDDWRDRLAVVRAETAARNHEETRVRNAGLQGMSEDPSIGDLRPSIDDEVANIGPPVTEQAGRQREEPDQPATRPPSNSRRKGDIEARQSNPAPPVNQNIGSQYDPSPLFARMSAMEERMETHFARVITLIEGEIAMKKGVESAKNQGPRRSAIADPPGDKEKVPSLSNEEGKLPFASFQEIMANAPGAQKEEFGNVADQRFEGQGQKATTITEKTEKTQKQHKRGIRRGPPQKPKK